MVNPVPQTAGDLIQSQLDHRAQVLEAALQADVLYINGGTVDGVDDLVRDMIVTLKTNNKDRDRLAVGLTTFGGSIEVVLRIVDMLRHNYDYVSFVIPNQAFSAGTVLAMSGDAIYMDYYSRLGPIDPQVQNATGRCVPALGYLIQWERLIQKANEGSISTAEVQLLIYGFDQAELYQYEQARELSIALLKEWLVKYKFSGWTKTETRGIPVTDDIRQQRAVEVATILNDTARWHTHGHGISMDVLQRDLNLQIDDFGQEPSLSRGVRDYHSLLGDYMAKTGAEGALHIVGELSAILVGGLMTIEVPTNEDILANNPHIDLDKLRESSELLKKLREAGVKARGYELAHPFAHRRISVGPKDDPKVVRLGKAIRK